MATLGHVAVGLATGRLHRRRLALSMVTMGVLSMLPDADVIGFAFGVPYHATWGHRGAFHSLAVAVLIGLAAALLTRRLGIGYLRAAVLAVATVASHGLLDAMTDGGLGVALLWPFTAERYFFPWRPIPVAPIGIRFVSERGLRILLVEGLGFSPLVVWALWKRRASAALPGR